MIALRIGRLVAGPVLDGEVADIRVRDGDLDSVHERFVTLAAGDHACLLERLYRHGSGTGPLQGSRSVRTWAMSSSCSAPDALGARRERRPA
ncbi:hypothetical protein AB852_24590 [Streptomyces uncialis]|uniref:Uncharacterized protein n=1 Tax=Streptomyces uncialis TaxID=1048205 RepID=A0A1Q4V2T2_9ACTN|nr:hypothetical protein AB852_24590 [Streptomyces uncialis]